MSSEKDALEAVRNRIAIRRKALELEITELDEMYRVLGAAQKIDDRAVSGGGKAERDRTATKPSVPYNMNLSVHVDSYLAALPYKDPPEAIAIKSMIETLRADYGVKGKDTSLYSYLHGVLKSKAKAGLNNLCYEKGVGFFKARKQDKTIVQTDSELVAAQ